MAAKSSSSKSSTKKKPIVFHMIGNAHLDPVWLWNWQAGADEALATFRSAADRCDEYRDFQYTRGEAWLYEIVELLDPQLFKRVLKAIKRGQWHVTGGEYVQPDCNLPTEEGWNQQLAVGLDYFRKRLGQKPTVGYNVDSFGHPATLPDILSAHGMRGYVFHRPNESQQKLPSNTFRWRGPEGGEVIGFRINPAYVTRTDDLYGQIMSVLDVTDPELGHVMCFYGLGNHGGGPSKETIEYIIENKLAFPGVVLEFSNPERYFDAISKRKNILPVFEGELQHTFPGCYSVMHDIKQAQHRNEYKLAQAGRLLSNLKSPKDLQKHFAGPLDVAWKDLLFTQFHDILAGTSIDGSWPSVRAKQGRALAIAEEGIVATTRRWARESLPSINHQQIVAVNSEPFAYEGMTTFEPYIDFDDWNNRWISTLEGKPVPFQIVSPDANLGAMTHAIVFPAKIAAKGHTTFLVRDDAKPKNSKEIKSTLKATAAGLSDGTTSVKLGAKGLASITHKGREIISEIGLRLIEDNGDTWVFHADHFPGEEKGSLSKLSWTIEEEGPLRARAYAEGKIGDSIARWSVDLPSGENAIVLRLEVHFRERYRMLQLDSKVASAVKKWRVGIPGGSVTRKPDSSEWPAQKWIAADNFGIATPDAYSVNHSEKQLRWTLLRSPLMAWAGQQSYAPGTTITNTDQGVHRFEFRILLGKPSVKDLDAAHRFMVCAPVVFDRYEGMNRPPWGNNPPRRLWTPDIPRARKDGRLMHLMDDEKHQNWEETPNKRD